MPPIMNLPRLTGVLVGRAVLALIGFAAFYVALVNGLNLLEAGQWATEQVALVAVAGIIAVVSLGTASRYFGLFS